jgi:hypothetical protein
MSRLELFKGLSEGNAEGKCTHYAYALKVLLDAAGIESRYVRGYANDGHAWLIVRADGKWGNVDPTWGDMDTNKDNWFFKTDAVFAKTHKVSACFETAVLCGGFVTCDNADTVEKPVCN